MKKTNKKEVQAKKSYINPAKRPIGKIIIAILTLSMVLSSFVLLVYMIIKGFMTV